MNFSATSVSHITLKRKSFLFNSLNFGLIFWPSDQQQDQNLKEALALKRSNQKIKIFFSNIIKTSSLIRTSKFFTSNDRHGYMYTHLNSRSVTAAHPPQWFQQGGHLPYSHTIVGHKASLETLPPASCRSTSNAASLSSRCPFAFDRIPT